MKEIFMFFMSLALGYILCVVAKKQTAVLKTVGYTLGAAIIALTLLSGLIMSPYACMKDIGKGCPHCKMMKHCGMHMKGMK
ncbi:MAG: hypothetical protein PHI58_02470 [Candidatus Omnitrophica bacterium]|nr:hypothetical protein [Candidatus Omnitrophota bacterium]